MKLNRLNVVIIIGFLAIIGTMIMQLFLLNQAYLFEKRETEDKIHSSLLKVVSRIYADNNNDIPHVDFIKKTSSNYYIVNVQNVFENVILEHYLKTEFTKVKLDLDFEYAIYDCGTNKMVYGNYISTNGKSSNKCEDCFTKNEDLIYYFALRFPGLSENLFSSLYKYWAYSFVLFIVLIIYVYSVLLLLKQKQYTELQNDFINNMTHEFKTPLSSILIASNYAKSQQEIIENPKLSKYVEIIINQSAKLNEHIENILTVAKSSNNSIELQKSKVDIIKNLDLIKENVELKHQKEVVFNLLFQNKYFINADEFHFYNLLFNLLENAVKYSINEPVIEINLVETEKNYNLTISDNGSGIPEKDLPFVFDKFYRVARQNNKDIEGFGIGLAYVKKICEFHNWKIKLSNKTDNTGLLVAIEIPKKDIYE
ncbi:HAMP domain-containing sensor histidine kinase [Flavobacterium sp.]|uniref:sensor histidine kinase n=1 Tax=Flavobacterium sp. TaxID=239 RepID=UPI002A83F4BB|nr:HAMP domain-containing sensor histidine kinase [Flavobacterium sp.]